MSENPKSGYKSLLLSKKALVVAIGAILLTLTLSAGAFMEDNTAAKKYSKNQGLSGASACGNGGLPLDIFCQNSGSEIQGDENAVGMASTQEATGVIEPYENLIDEVTLQSVIGEERDQKSDIRKSSILDRIDTNTPESTPSSAGKSLDQTSGFALVTPGTGNDKQIESRQL